MPSLSCDRSGRRCSPRSELRTSIRGSLFVALFVRLAFDPFNISSYLRPSCLSFPSFLRLTPDQGGLLYMLYLDLEHSVLVPFCDIIYPVLRFCPRIGRTYLGPSFELYVHGFFGSSTTLLKIDRPAFPSLSAHTVRVTRIGHHPSGSDEIDDSSDQWVSEEYRSRLPFAMSCLLLVVPLGVFPQLFSDMHDYVYTTTSVCNQGFYTLSAIQPQI